MSNPNAPLLLTIKETAQLLQISPRKLWQMAKQREIPCVRIGKLLRFPQHALKEWLESQINSK